MIKYTFILLAAYFLYYTGNIVYDLFLKKEKSVQTDVAEEFSLADFAEEGKQPNQIGIEDVENIKTPNSFIKKELPSQKQTSFEENPDLEELRRKFEAEQDMEEPIPAQNETKAENDNLPDNANSSRHTLNESEDHSKKKETENRKTLWKELLNLSETTVQMVANYEGQKVYHSTM